MDTMEGLDPPIMVADHGGAAAAAHPDHEWVRQELLGVEAIFKRQGTNLEQLGQVQQSMQAEMQAMSAQFDAMRELAESVMNIKRDIEMTWASHEEASAVAETRKREEIAEIVREMRKMMVSTQKNEAACTSVREEVVTIQQQMQVMMSEMTRISEQQSATILGLQTGLSNANSLMLAVEGRLTAALHETIEQQQQFRQQQQQQQQVDMAAQQQHLRVAYEEAQRSGATAAAAAAAEAALRSAGVTTQTSAFAPATFRLNAEEDRDERRGGGSMMKGVMKALTPHRVFEGKAEHWKEWKEDLEEFWELHHQGAKAALKEMAETGDTHGMEVCLGAQAADGKATMHALLRSLTTGEAKKITSGYESTEAWESWKALCKHYEPVMAVQKHQALDHYLALAKCTAKSPDETRRALITVDERRRQAIRHVGTESVQLIQKHILESVLDPETKKVCYNHMSLDYEQYKEKITEYLAAAQKTRTEKMELGWCGEDSAEETAVGEEDAPSTSMGEESDECLAYYNSQGWQVKGGRRTKGKGKGKGKGPSDTREQGTYGQKGERRKGRR